MYFALFAEESTAPQISNVPLLIRIQKNYKFVVLFFKNDLNDLLVVDIVYKSILND